MAQRGDDWFQRLAYAALLRARHQTSARDKQRLLKALDALERTLDSMTPKRDFDRHFLLSRWAQPVMLDPAELRRAEALCQRVYVSSGTGKAGVEEALLFHIGVQADAGSLPFYRATVEQHKERDQLQPLRRRRAVAATTLLALVPHASEARAQLERWMAHPDASVRTEAVWGRAFIHLQPEGTLSPSVVPVLRAVAREDPAFPVRFIANRSLYLTGAGPEMHPPDGVFVVRASLGDVSRTLQLPSTMPIASVATALIRAFDWSHDHLWEFALTGDVRARRFVVPDEDAAADEMPSFGLDDLEEVDDFDEGGGAEVEPPGRGEAAHVGIVMHPTPGSGPPMAHLVSQAVRPGPSQLDWPLGGLGLRQNQVFLFRYDSGDDHRFRLKVMDTLEQRNPRVKYPRTIERKGRAPAQYRRW